ncbi:hypothetical protein [Chryseobacterium sp. ERMR1:04]|uniref:hypothetical protein n=1 Tax=Chryseobacterium sp. ERMR1:04 TaxID=1705393 RepID=UPI0006C8CE55|nr:hypothetical protein [Chryseobacterium sp. ERMR1:04]KPH13392.1 hypothetical protein AMQ68_13195 [Chryseobacterium sp. ERMR1:04]
MNGNMHVINAGAFMKTINDVNCSDLKIGFLDSEHFELRFTNVQPPAEYSEPENFPDCCTFHKNILIKMESYFQRFPLCCTTHSKLPSQKWFDKANYSNIPNKTLHTIRSSECQVFSKIEAADWYEDITEYFEYCVYSFGQFPSGYGIALGLDCYLNDLSWFLEDHIERNTLPVEKLRRLVDYLTKYRDKANLAEKSDVNILIGLYNKWLKTFPFEISYFTHLKDLFANNIPLLTGQVSNNRYLGTSSSKIISYNDLLKFLTDMTSTILTSFNALKLADEGKLDNIEVKTIEVANAKRRLELLELNEKIKGGRKQYIKLIKKWLKGETEYLQIIGPILKKSIQNSIFNN